ncbi:methylenetetrahydrofolate dehydrogenase (NADP+) / methenyltetrahydrofolate cyclohydrolase [Patescibacteria group bacterium]|nr:bifunctional 5,10-methylenetetrahydrofolate dehydrogenase/5,10-methenyltetrahydrofolate cyclohydrolase [Candidatus Dojkabacteria bacterium]CAG1022924.1 methylenetetrahydrofolate dehydrogenase (NADP+) / methenyltetrahydrofolate cyclohydrolase [Patescibacteria group bacterium]
MQLVDSKKITENIYAYIKEQIIASDKPIKLAIIDAGNDAASKKYIALKMQKGMELGIQVQLINFKEDVKIEEVLSKIDELNKDDSVNGILVQLPLFEHLAPYKHRILNSINPIKDTDGLSAINFGLYSQDILNGILPATVDACLEVVKEYYKNDFNGSNVLIVNNSDLIGKPLATVFATLNATVTIANEFTKNLEDLFSTADIIVTATGKGELFDFDSVQDGSLVVDVTSIKKDDKVVGDFKDRKDNNKDITYTPVPGGIGPITVACLYRNLVNLSKLQK